MSDYADTMSGIEETRAYEEGRLRAFHEIATFIDYNMVMPHDVSPVVVINKEIERQIKFTKEAIKEAFGEEEE